MNQSQRSFSLFITHRVPEFLLLRKYHLKYFRKLEVQPEFAIYPISLRKLKNVKIIRTMVNPYIVNTQKLVR